MGFLEDLGLGELIASVNEMRGELDGLKDDLMSSITDSTNDFSGAVDDISSSISGEDTTK